jgi:8-oxo-dGTP diphosphatase
MQGRKQKAPILAAGGVVLRGSREPLVAVVQLRNTNHWVLPKGKINRNETVLAAARREVLEEVGHKTYVHAFLGMMAYDVGARIKIVQFWAMRAIGDQARRLMPDVKAVEWLSLEDAIERLSRSREREFLRNVGPVAIKAIQRSTRRAEPLPATRHAYGSQAFRARAYGRGEHASRAAVG